MLNDELKDTRKRLEVAINEALTESPRVAEVIQRIRGRGYEVFLIIEATIGMSRSKGRRRAQRAFGNSSGTDHTGSEISKVSKDPP